MYTISANDVATGIEFFWVLSLAESAIMLFLMYWHFLFAADDFHLMMSAAPALPALSGEVRRWFSWRYWAARLLRLFARTQQRRFLSPPHIAKFLLQRDGQKIFLFLAPALNDIPPPAHL